MNTEPPFTISAAANYLGCSVNQVRRMITEGHLRHFKVGRLVRISQEAMHEFEQRQPNGHDKGDEHE